MKEKHISIGFGMSVTANDRAMNNFARMSEDERQDVLEKARNVKSKEEMDRLIQGLSERENFH